MSLRIRPVTIKAAQRFVRAHHRKLPNVQGGLFAVAVEDADHQVRGVAIVGRPIAKADHDGVTCEVVRVAVDGAAGSRNACSMLYARCRRVSQLLGYVRCRTKTLPSEGGGKSPRSRASPSRADARRGVGPAFPRAGGRRAA